METENKTVEALESIKNTWKKGKTAKIVMIILGVLFWPITLLILCAVLYYRFNKPLKRWVAISILLLLTLPVTIGWISGISSSFSNDSKQAFKSGYEVGTTIGKPSSTPTSTPTNTPTPTLSKTDDYLNQLYGEMEKATLDDIIVLVDTDRGFIQATRHDDGGWWVVQIMNWWPEFGANFAIKSITRNFIYQVYHSDKNIKQVGITIQSGGKYSRAFVGANQAKKLKEDDWQYLQPTNFYNWIKEVETSREESDRANATFLEENL